MPNTRSKSGRNSVKVKNQEKTETQIFAAKTRATRSSNNKTNRQYLQNITNPKISSSDKTTRTLQEKASHQKRSAKMGSNNSEELSDKSATVPLETSAMGQRVPEMEARLKRKSVDDSAFQREVTAVSQTKISAINGFANMETKEPMDVDEVEVEVHTTEFIPKTLPVLKTTSPPQIQTSPTPINVPLPVIVDDGEKPSTSKLAMAALAAASAAATIAAAAAEAKAKTLIATFTTIPTPKNSPAASNVASTTGRIITSSGNQHTSTATFNDGDGWQSTDSIMLNDAASNSSTNSTKEPMPLPEKLLLVISNLYLNAADRLKLNFPPRCAEDLEYCHQHHYRSALPEAPNHTQANNLRCALQQQRYVSFINLSYDMCHRGEFPGEGIFTKLIELVLSFNAKCYNNDSLGYFFNKSIELFSFIVRKFPPCWLTLRKFYINFLQSSLDVKKISKKDEQPFKADNVLEILFELFATTLEQCSSADLRNDVDSFNVTSEATAATGTSPSNQNNVSMETSSEVPQKISEASQNSEYMNIWEWEVQENRLQTFEALKAPRTRLERLLISLQLLLQILEKDFVMWILHHHKKAKEWIFCEENRPFVVMVFAMSKYTRCTRLVKQLFTLFSISVSKRARRFHLEILERYISLVMVASNIADLEHSALGVHYPNLGGETKTLIYDFFKTFKSHNTSQVASYLNTIDLLRIPYVRYEFIDCFLQLFHFASKEPLTTKKIATDLFKKRWLKYKPKAELAPDCDDDLSREQYMQLLLKALQAYCDFHGLRAFFQLLTDEQSFDSFQFVTDSVHRYPTKGCGLLMLERMSSDIKQLEKQLRMTVRMSKPKATLPLVDICINDELLLKYRTDLKYVMVLNDIIEWQPEVDATTTTHEAKKTAKKSTSASTADQVKKSSTAASSADYTVWRKFLSDYATVEK